jgi:RuvB-like protein 1 (pontin 52)
MPASSSSIPDRVAAHTHITGLGLSPITGHVEEDDAAASSSISSCGLVGQTSAREAAGLVVDLVKQRQLAGRGVLLVGPSSTGKTALAVAMAKELSGSAGTGSSGSKQHAQQHAPFAVLQASQVYSSEVGKTAVLAAEFRKAIGVRIREEKEVYEGEVTELTVQETEDAHSATANSYGRSISHVILGLKTAKGTKTLKLDPTLYTALSQEHVQVGDVIYIEANSGAVKRVGRSDTFATEFDLEAEEYAPLPKGEVHKRKHVVQDVTLHDLDVANAHPTAGKDTISLLQSLQRPRKTDLTDKLRGEINAVVEKYVEQGVAEVLPGILFVEEAHMLDLECFGFLQQSLESQYAPVLVLATNRGMASVAGTTTAVDPDGMVSPHGIPVDFLDRLLLIPTRLYNVEEMRRILELRAAAEKVPISKEAIRRLADVAQTQKSLRYAMQLLAPAQVLCQLESGATASGQHDENNALQVHHVEAAAQLFLDAKASARKMSSLFL